MDRLERLINLTAALLQAERPLTVDELRERVPGYAEDKVAFHRAFERDKDVLRELGVPIEVAPVDPNEPRIEGYRVPREAYELHDPGLAPDELAALNLAALAVRLPGARGVEALWKLGGAVLGAQPPATVALPGSEHLAAFFQAIAERRLASFTYRGRPRTFAPERLAFRNGHWYVVGVDREHDEERSYRLDRLESSVTTGERDGFTPRGQARGITRPWEMGEDEPVVARVLVDADQAAWAVGHLGEDAVVTRRDDGAVELAIQVTNRAAFRSFVLGFLDHAEVLAPDALRREMIEWLEQLCPR